jgi:transcriptional regulator with XRE-family HTH domain
VENQDAFYAEVGRRVRSARDTRGLTQEALATLVSLTRTSITNIEKGRQKLLAHTIVDLATALKVSPATLLPEDHPAGDGKKLDQLLKDRSPKERAWVKSVLSSQRKEK